MSSLRILIQSFSFRKGLPFDETGHGGGYVFDCRAITNPGRLPEFAQLTGKDAAVINFLERSGEVQPFLSHVFALADAHIARYLERGFTSLTFSFGCTGGQHRSVYCAERLAAHVSERFPNTIVEIRHKEQSNCSIFPNIPEEEVSYG